MVNTVPPPLSTSMSPGSVSASLLSDTGGEYPVLTANEQDV
jgi:hypothetical protein